MGHTFLDYFWMEHAGTEQGKFIVFIGYLTDFSSMINKSFSLFLLYISQNNGLMGYNNGDIKSI